METILQSTGTFTSRRKNLALTTFEVFFGFFGFGSCAPAFFSKLAIGTMMDTFSYSSWERKQGCAGLWFLTLMDQTLRRSSSVGSVLGSCKVLETTTVSFGSILFLSKNGSLFVKLSRNCYCLC